MLNPVVHNPFSVNLMGGILQNVGTLMMAREISFCGNVDTEKCKYDVTNLLRRTKTTHEVRATEYNYNIVNVAVCIGLIYEEFKEGNMLNPFNLLR